MMELIEKLLGVMLVVSVVMWSADQAIDAFIAHPNWFGATMAFFTIVTGCFVIASVVRDRL